MLPNVFIFTEEFKNPYNTYFQDPVVPDPLPPSLQNYPLIQTSEIAPNTTSLEKNIPCVKAALPHRTSVVFHKITSLWTEEETDELRRAVDECKNPNGSICWKEVGTRVKKTPRACREKYKRLKISKPSECYWSKRQLDALAKSVKTRRNKKRIIWGKVVKDMQNIRPGNKKTFKSRYYEWNLANGELENQEQRSSTNSQDDQVNAKSTETTDKEVSKIKTSKKRKKSSKSRRKIKSTKTKNHSAKKAKVSKETRILADELEAYLTDDFQPENEQNNKKEPEHQEKCSSTNTNSTETKDREASQVQTKKRKKTSERKHKTKSTKSKHSAKKAKVDRSSKINAQTIAEELEASLTVAPSSELETEPGEKNPKWLKEHTIFLEKILKTSFSPKTKINWKWVAKRFYYLHGIKFKYSFLQVKGVLVTGKKTAEDLENEANSQNIKKFVWSKKTRKRLVKLVARYWRSNNLWAKIELKFNDHKTDLPFVPRQHLQKKYKKIRNNKTSKAKNLTPPNPDNNPASVSLENQEGEEPQTIVYKDKKGFWSPEQNEAFEEILKKNKNYQGKIDWPKVEKAMKGVKEVSLVTLKGKYWREHLQLGDRPDHEFWWTEEQTNALVGSAIKHTNKAGRIVWKYVVLDLKTIKPHTTISGFKSKYGRISPEVKERIRLAEELAKEKENACPTPEAPPTQNYTDVVSTPYSIEASASPIQNTNGPNTTTPFFAEQEDSEDPLASLNSLLEDWI